MFLLKCLSLVRCWAVLDIVPQTNYCEIVSHVTDYDNNSGTIVTVAYTQTPGSQECLEDLSLEQ